MKTITSVIQSFSQSSNEEVLIITKVKGQNDVAEIKILGKLYTDKKRNEVRNVSRIFKANLFKNASEFLPLRVYTPFAHGTSALKSFAKHFTNKEMAAKLKSRNVAIALGLDEKIKTPYDKTVKEIK